MDIVDILMGRKGKSSGGGGDITIDSQLSATSKNPVQNKVVKAAVDDLSRHVDQKQDAPSTAGTAGQVLSLDDQLQPVWVNQTGGGLSEATKQALLQIAQKVAYTDDQGEQYYNDLYDALYPPAELISIDAVFNQGVSTIYDDDNLDSLRDYLVVTAYYDNAESRIITTYTLSGRLTAGISIITASYQGKSDTFEVNVTEHTEVHTYSSANGLVTFEEDAEAPVKMICAFQPVQSGSGTPSAENIRAISGWGKCEYGRAMLSMPTSENGWTVGYLSDNSGNINISNSNGEMTSDFFPVEAGKTISISIWFSETTPSGTWFGRLFYDSNKNVIGVRKTKNNAAANTMNYEEVVPSGASYMRFSFRTYDIVSKILAVYKPAISSTINFAVGSIPAQMPVFTQSGSGTPAPNNQRSFIPGVTFTRDDQSVINIWSGTFIVDSNGFGTIEDNYIKCIINGNVTKSTTTQYYDSDTTYGYITNLPVHDDGSDVIYYGDILDYSAAGAIWNNHNLVNVFGKHTSNTNICIRVSNTDFGVDPNDTIDDRVATVNAYLAEHPLTVLLQLSTPVTYTLTQNETSRMMELLGVHNFGIQYAGEIVVYKDGSADLKAIPGYIDSYAGETLSGNYISSQAAPNTTPVTGSQVFDFGASPIQTYHMASVDGLETVIGQNNIYHMMNGSITVEY